MNDNNLAHAVASSSQFEGGFDFGEDVFGAMDAIGEIGDELARELGEGWGGSPAQQRDNASGLLHLRFPSTN